ncbi:MAG TPA: ATP-binding cassette domain-containing protein [bacterium]|nr:ATP-binding cassette domain-containing protein [bacterium]
MNAGGGARLRLDGISVRGETAWPLRDITVDVAPGEALGVLGPRGSGKTALLDVISGFLRPARGRIVLDGEDITGWRAHRIARAGVARSFQAPPFLEGTMIHEAISAAAIGRGLTARATREAVRRALAITGLEARAYDTGAALGPAEQRLLTVARVAAAAPRLALLDEPLAGLAPGAAGLIVSALRRLDEFGITLIVTAHDPASLRAVCARAALLRGGRIVGAGRPAEIHRA